MTWRRTIDSERVLEVDGNAFGVLRLVLAAFVIVSHSWSLGGYGREPLFELSRGATLGYLAVSGFFGLSGALVGLSAERTSPGKFLVNRARRILPGYWACLAVTALGIGAVLCWLQGLPLTSGLGTPEGDSARAYIANNFLLRADQGRVGHVLDSLPYLQSINGSLWSLPYEFVCYLLVLLAVQSWLLARRGRALLAGLLFVSVAMAIVTESADAKFRTLPIPLFGPLDPQHFYFLWAVFLVGAALALWRERIPFSPLAVAVTSAIFLASLPLGLFKPYGGLLLPYVILGLGRYLPRGLRPIGRRTDLSYGMYLYGFPVGQAVVAAGKLQGSGVALACWTLLLTLPLAAGSWFLVERPFLRS